MVDRRAYDPSQPAHECRDCEYDTSELSHAPRCPDCGGSMRTASLTR